MIDYREIPARAPLDRFIRCFWFLVHEAAADPVPETILPDGHPELIFEFGRPYRDPSERAAPPQRCFAVGQITRAIAVVPTGRVELLGVRFRPAGLAPLFRDKLSVMTDGQLELGLWAPPRIAELEERLHELSSWQARLELLERALAAEPVFQNARPSPIETAVALALRSRGNSKVDALAHAAGVSTRTLDRRFRDEVGLSPKLFLRQIRFRHVFDLIDAGAQIDWADIALTTGCYDQAHLVREFRAFADQSPAAFLRGEHELSDHLTGLADGHPLTS